MIHKKLENIDPGDLKNLLGMAQESKTLEFKQAMPAKSDREVIQFLSAVSAFANAAGGDLLIGITAEDGIATALSGVPLAGFDDEKLRLEQLMADNIQPRLPVVGFHSVPCGDANHVIVVRVQRSWLAPHRVTKNDKFYGRNSGGKYPLDVGELRSAFALRENVSERIRAFRADRLAKIAAEETPCRLLPSTSMVLHVVPIPSFGDRRLINVAEELSVRPVTLPVPLGSNGAGHGVNLDGVFLYSGPSMTEAHGYGLLFRDGSIEGVKQLSILDDKTPYIAGSIFEQDVLQTLKVYMKTCEQLEAGMPLFVGLSFCNARGCVLRAASSGVWTTNGISLKDEVIALPECIVESANADLPRALKPIFDVVWNAFGYMQSDKYDQSGKWIGTT
ncbi:MAG: ATP-binding protein [Bradyrhizobiaceae bacterium]|nr:MAG: ATP-binding protein [Bradyrhizobiaceae bacterium]